MQNVKNAGYLRSDLACESAELEKPLKGVEQTERQIFGVGVQRVRILTEEAAIRLGKPCGCYVHIDCGRIDRLDRERFEITARLIAGEVCGMAERLTGNAVGSDLSVLVAGLGNAELTADALGPQTVQKMSATRHLKTYARELFERSGCASLSLFSPGVLGQTGIETSDLICGASRAAMPDVVIVADALAARSCARLASTVQISDVGILPGSGVGNCRAAIDRKTLGVPVIAIGVPTVVDSSTLVFEALQKAGIDHIEPALQEVLETGKSFFVSPKESDVITERVSDLLSRALTLALIGASWEELLE